MRFVTSWLMSRSSRADGGGTRGLTAALFEYLSQEETQGRFYWHCPKDLKRVARSDIREENGVG